ncbi:hypothetical protein CDL12_05563 [Handroanthus impetiginosus]|uniref:Uncharacterized protein n=1 Tax=Handroanthus impetiginosus TaxID=429701 RepID=A0A2G9HW34_9LAMI|nr:hypothetical protein CDL12_05563 [Handroanthus impetiginosus]
MLYYGANTRYRWSVIASPLPGRTDNDVKNYWNTKLKRKLLAAEKATSSILTKNVFMRSKYNFNLAPSEASNHSVDICPNNMVHGSLESPYTCGLLPSPSLSQEAISSISSSFSLDNTVSGSASWSTSGSGEDDTFLAGLRFGLTMPYNIPNAFGFEEKFSIDDQINYHPNQNWPNLWD